MDRLPPSFHTIKTKCRAVIGLAIIFLNFFFAKSSHAQANLLREYIIQSGASHFTTTADSGLAIMFEHQNSHYLIKTDSLLNETISVQLSIPFAVQPQQIIQTTDHGFLLGFAHPNGAMLVKTDSALHVLWTYTYDRGWSLYPEGMLPTSVNGAIIVNNDFSYFAINSAGTVISSSIVTDFNYSFYASSFIRLNNGYYVFGHTQTGVNDLFLASFDSSFQLISLTVYPTNLNILTTSIRAGINNNLVITGYTRTYNPLVFFNPLLLSVDLNGNFQWCKVYAGISTMSNDVYTDPSGFYIMGGLGSDSMNNDPGEVFIRTLADGTFQNSFITGNSYSGGFGFETVNELLPGYHNDFYAVSTNFLLKSSFQMSPFCYYDPLNYTDSVLFFSTNISFPTLSTVNFILTPVVVTESQMSLAHFVCDNVKVHDGTWREWFTIDYISNKKLLLFHFRNAISPHSISITDLSGHTILSKTVNNCSEFEISVFGLKAGAYLVTVTGGDVHFTKLIVKEE